MFWFYGQMRSIKAGVVFHTWMFTLRKVLFDNLTWISNVTASDFLSIVKSWWKHGASVCADMEQVMCSPCWSSRAQKSSSWHQKLKLLMSLRSPAVSLSSDWVADVLKQEAGYSDIVSVLFFTSDENEIVKLIYANYFSIVGTLPFVKTKDQDLFSIWKSFHLFINDLNKDLDTVKVWFPVLRSTLPVGHLQKENELFILHNGLETFF